MPERSKLCDNLIGALVGLARATDGHGVTDKTYGLIIEGLSLTGTADGDGGLEEKLGEVRGEKAVLTPGCAACQFPCGRTNDFDMEELYSSSEDVRQAKEKLLYDMQQAARKIVDSGKNCCSLGETVDMLFCKGVFLLGEYITAGEILNFAEQFSKINL